MLLFLIILISNFVIKNAPVNANTLPPTYSKIKCGRIDTSAKYISAPKGTPIVNALYITISTENTENKIPQMKIIKSATKLCANNPMASPLTSENEIDLLD